MTNAAKPEHTPEQISLWRTREQERLDSGTYTLLSRAWRHSYWFRYGMEGNTLDEYLNNNDHCWPPYTAPYLNHFAHVSLTDGAMIAFTENDAKGIADRQTKMKPGKYLTKFFSHVLTPLQITELATAFSAEFAPMELQFASDADDIEHVYRSGPSSCMSYGANSYSSSEHPVRAYAGPDLQVAYIARGDDDVTARAIVWPAKKRFGRIYGDAGRLKPLLVAAGYSTGSMVSARISAIEDEGQYVVPYVDGISYGERDGRYIVLGHGDINLQRTDGLSGSAFTCDHCGDGMSEDDGFYCEDDGETMCEDCHGNHRFYCERLERDCAGMSYMVNGERWSEAAFDRYGATCARTEDYFPANEMVTMADGETWHQSTFAAEGFTCAGNGQHYPADDMVTLADGAQWSKDHFDAYGTKVDGVAMRSLDAPADMVRYRCPDTLELPLSAPAGDGEIKAGDWVECLGYCEGQFTAGKVYQVRDRYNDGVEMVGIVADDAGSPDNGWSLRYFRPWVYGVMADERIAA